MIPEAAIKAASWAIVRGNNAGHHAYKIASAALEAAAPHIAAQALEDVAALALTNDPLDFWAMHTPEGTDQQRAMSLWLTAHARAKMSQTPDDFATPRG